MQNKFEIAGSVKWFNMQRGYGFITPDTGPPDILFLKSTLRRLNLNYARPGSRTKCLVEQTPKGLLVAEFISIDRLFAPSKNKTRGVRPIAILEPATVKSFYLKRGFGFLKSQSEPVLPDIFVHIETMRRCGIEALEPGQQVRVTYGRGATGLIALSLEN